MISAKNLDVDLGLSLKACAPALAKLLGTTPDSIYERQRALVRAGLLEESAARGPGGGVRATTKSIATLLVAFLGANELRDISTHVRKVLSLREDEIPSRRFERGTAMLDALVEAGALPAPFETRARNALISQGDAPLPRRFETGTTMLDALTWAIQPYGPAGGEGLDMLLVSRTAPEARISGVSLSAQFGKQANMTYTKPFLVSAQLWLPAAMHMVIDLAEEGKSK